MTYATVDDMTALWRPMTEAEQARAGPLLEVISASLDVEARKVGKDLSALVASDSALALVSLQLSPKPSTFSSNGPRRPRKARTDMKKKISAGTLTRTAALGLALTNQLLSAAGKPLLPIDNAQLEQMISTGFTVGAALAAWWKNNSFTSEAIEADEFMTRLKKSVY